MVAMAVDPDKRPTPSEPNGQCSRCGFYASFSQFGQSHGTRPSEVRAQNGGRQPLERVTLLTCQGCNESIIVVESRSQLTDSMGSLTAEFGHWQPILWWPPVDGGVLPAAVPAGIARWYDEGMRCLGAGAPNGAVTMFRNAMVALVADKGSEEAKKKGDLAKQVKQLVTDRALDDSLGAWVDHVRLTGNAGAHPDKFGDVSLEEAQELVGLIKSLFELLYIIPDRITARQAKRFSTP